MKNKNIFIIVSIFILSIILYKEIGKNIVKNKMIYYLENKNYYKSDIKSIDVSHYFINKILSYNEWVIKVVYEDEPTSIYFFTLKNGEIVDDGVSGTTDKEDLNH
ncbi:MAG: hypothetical protein QM266_05825 [Bacillota bacterium]|nr:hypothetical protein [Bacillota bacterium]